MRNKIVYIFFFFCFVSCAKYKDFIIQEVKDFKIENINLSKSIVHVNLELYNPNTFNINIDKIDCDVKMNDIYIGKIHFNQMLIAPKNNTFILPLNIEINHTKLILEHPTILIDKKKKVQLNGTIHAGKMGFYRTIKFDKSINLK